MAVPLLQNKSDYLHSGSADDPRLSHADLSDQIQVWNSAFGQGYKQTIPLRDDLSLVIGDDKINNPLVISSPGRKDAALNFEFQLSGAASQQSSFSPQLGPMALDMRHAQQRTFRIEVLVGPSAFMTYYQRITDRLSPQALTSLNQFIELAHYGLFGGRPDSPRQALEQMLTPSNISPPSMEQIMEDFCSTPGLLGSRLTTEQDMTVEMNEVINQILSCPYGGRSRRTYLEKKALELVSLKLHGLEQWSTPAYPLRFEDLDSIHAASKILATQLQDPPPIEKLARQVGLNRFKLNQGFHHVFGTTPFRYLRTCRLELAFHLLFTSQEPVEEIAYRVGYENRSRFAAAFRKEFGLNPKVFQLQMSTCDDIFRDRQYAS
ncbi:MAG: helix-turn-helix domain-containing protein [Cyanophyceae cyanobacterium]